MKLNLVFPCPQSVSIPFSVPFLHISVFPAKCMQHPQNDTMPHSLGSKTCGNKREFRKRDLISEPASAISLTLLYHCTPFAASDLIKPKNASREGSWQQTLGQRGWSHCCNPTGLWAEFAQRPRATLTLHPMSEHTGVNLHSQLQGKTASRCGWGCRSTSCCTAAQVFSQYRAPKAWPHLSFFPVPGLSGCTAGGWCFQPPGRCRVQGQGHWPPCCSPFLHGCAVTHTSAETPELQWRFY